MRPGWQVTIAACLMIGLQACSSGPTAFMAPTANAPEGASRVDMLVVTTRKPSDDPNVLFTGERGFDYLINEVAVSLPPASARTPGQVQWPKTSTPDPATEFAVLSVQRRTLDEIDPWIEKQAGADGRLMIFVHGFNTRFGAAVFRYAQIIKDSGAPVAPVLFTWPSRGGIYAYNYDRESTNFSRDALEAGLLRAAHNDKVKEITVLAHSMGAWLAMEALRQSAIREGRVPAKVTNVILASPDLDIDVFVRQFQMLGPERPKFTIFVSNDDRALRLSRLIAGNVGRLGAINPSQEPYLSLLENSGITVIDMSKLRTGDRLNHSKFAESPDVVKLIGQRLIEGQPLTDSRAGIGDHVSALAIGATKFVGSAAGVIISTPIAVVDPATRENLNSQIEGMTGAVGAPSAATQRQEPR